MNCVESKVKDTFSNLPAEKQTVVIAAAVHEFACQGYQKASINTIVKTAGIAKGSFYQYFHNKEALFVFIFDHFTELVKKTVKQTHANRQGGDFFELVRQVLLAGIDFIDRYPDYFQIYLKVLFEQNVPHRGQLLSKVRLFSQDFFGPLCAKAQKQGVLRQDVPLKIVIFILDATLDRFLQSYAQSYLDCGLDLQKKDRSCLVADVDMVLLVLREGLVKITN